MSMFPNYLIKQSHPRFPQVFDDWVTSLVIDLVQRDLTEKWAETFCFVLSTQSRKPEVTVLKDLFRMLHVAEQSRFDMLWCGYDTDYVDYASLVTILDSYNRRRRRRDYQIYAASAFQITVGVNLELIDEPIPDLNIMAITYAGQRRNCFG